MELHPRRHNPPLGDIGLLDLQSLLYAHAYGSLVMADAIPFDASASLSIPKADLHERQHADTISSPSSPHSWNPQHAIYI